MGGETWQSGGDIWLVVMHRADGRLVVLSDEARFRCFFIGLIVGELPIKGLSGLPLDDVWLGENRFGLDDGRLALIMAERASIGSSA